MSLCKIPPLLISPLIAAAVAAHVDKSSSAFEHKSRRRGHNFARAHTQKKTKRTKI